MQASGQIGNLIDTYLEAEHRCINRAGEDQHELTIPLLHMVRCCPDADNINMFSLRPIYIGKCTTFLRAKGAEGCVAYLDVTYLTLVAPPLECICTYAFFVVAL